MRPGYWLSGQNFTSQPLAELWQHWHLKVESHDFTHALAQGWVEVLEYQQRLKLTIDSQILPGQYYRFWMPDHAEADTDTGWKLLWQHPELMAVHKPADLPVSRTTRNLFDTLISRVRRETPYSDAHLLHRLDAETSGIMLLANESHYDRKWKKRLERLLARKIYLALVDGQPHWQQLDYRCWLAERSGSAIRSKVYVVGEGEQPPQDDDLIKPKSAQTIFTVLAKQGAQALIACELKTGRRHQIRAQLAHLGLPIVGDKTYHHNGLYYLKRIGAELGPADWAVLHSRHQLLHAWQIELDLYGEAIRLADPYLSEQWPEWVKNHIGDIHL